MANRPVIAKEDDAKKQKARDRARQWRIDHPERAKAAYRTWANRNKDRVRAYGEQYYEKNRGDRPRRQRRSIEELCESARKRAREWYSNNKERALSNVKLYCENNGEKISERRKVYREANSEHIKVKQRSYYAANPSAYKERSRAWRKNNPESVKAYGRNRRARMVGAEGNHTNQEIMELMQKQRHECAYCHANIRETYHADHIVPLIRGGSNWIHNIQLLCASCNLKKNARHPVEFAQSMGLLV